MAEGSGYIEFPIEVNAETLIEEVFADLEDQIDGWEPAAGNLETFLIRAIVYRLIVPLAQLAADVPPEVFDRWGEEIAEVERHLASAATGATTWKMTDNGGYKIPAGTEIGVPVSGSEARGFRTVNEVIIPPGSTETAAGEVLIEAIEAGTQDNELEGEATLEDALALPLDSIKLVGATSTGEDEEEPTVYLGRLRETMETLAPRPIIAKDVAILARNVPGVGRSVAIDNYNAETEEGEQEKTTTVVVTDAEGEACIAAVKEAVEAELAAKREANYIFFVVDAQYKEIDLTCVFVEAPGFDHAAVKVKLEAALDDFFDPAKFGQRPPGDAKSWVNATTIRYQDLVTVVNNVEGLDYYTTLKFALKGGEQKAADLALGGAYPLPKKHTFTVT
jgi:Baseplate J-like protein